MKKKTVIIWANCQGSAIQMMLNKYYKDIFDVHVYQNYEYIKNNIKLPEIFYKCDIFIYQNYSFKDNIDYEINNIIDNILPKESQKIGFPTLHRNYLQFPFNCESPENQKTISNNLPFGKFFYGIENIRNNVYKYLNMGYNNDIIIKNILNDVKNDDYISTEQIQKHENETLSFLQLKALNSDVPDIYSFILNNYKLKRLWHNPNHPNGILLNELCRLIFLKINIPYISNDNDICTLDNLLRDWKMPIFNSVVKYYNMENIDNNCNSWFHETITDLDTYISEYIKFFIIYKN